MPTHTHGRAPSRRPSGWRQPYHRSSTGCHVLFLALFSLAARPALAAPYEFKSNNTQTSLLELYTSEGCSSCPPADKWLSGLTNSPALWKDIVPVAFHVDYWNRLGWRDRWSRNEFTARQREYAHQWRAKTIYTPAYVLNGREWRPRTAALPKRTSKDVGVVQCRSKDGKSWTIEFKPTRSDQNGPWLAHIALLGAGLNSKVRAGENSGRELRHDFVVLGLQSTRLRDRDGVLQGTSEFSETAEAPRRAIAVWISRSDLPDPLQATGGWLE